MSRLASLLVLGAVLVGCAVNPVTGKREFSLISESEEIAIGREGASQTVAQLGLYPDSSLQAYVTALGQRLAAGSERPQLPWSFAVVQDPVVNAFALPGGYIFVTHGILAHFNSEAELVSVLGHEIGHVTAKHSVTRISNAQLAQLGLGVGQVLAPDLGVLHQIAAGGLGVLFLKFGRDDESQSDDLGFRYMVDAGYDPREATSMFQTLDRVSGGGRIPEWQSTHPSPENRISDAQARVASMAIDPASLKVGRDEYLRRLDGLVFGADPRQGYFDDDGLFHHPELAFRVKFPQGWRTANYASAVLGLSQSQDAALQLTLAEGSPAEAATSFGSQNGVTVVASSSQPINGFTAERRSFQATTNEGTLSGTVAFIDFGGNTVQLMGYTTAASYGQYRAVLDQAVTSFARETDPAVLNVQPDRIEIVRLPRRMTVEQFIASYPSAASDEQVRIINGVDPGAVFPAGSLVKRVVSP